MSSAKRFLPAFVCVLLLVACGVPAAITETIAPSTPTVAQNPTPTNTPIPAQLSLGAPIIHILAGQEIKITSIHMLDAMNGWGIGGPLDSEGNSHILRTADGGLTWGDVTPPEPASDPQSSKKAIGFFMDTQKAWVAFATMFPGTLDQVYLWRTTDGGATWQYSVLTEPALYQESYTPSDLSFVDAQHGWMMAHVGAGMNHDYYALLATADGGATWQTLVTPQEDSSGTQSCVKSGIVFATTQDGWMTVNCHGVVSIPYFFKTEDGGASWESVSLPAPSSTPDLFDGNHGYCDMEPPVFFTPTNADLILNCTQYTDTVIAKQSFLYETTNAGTSWNTYPYPGGKLQFIDPLTAFALGWEIHRSDDAGHTWLGVITALSQNEQFSFIDAQFSFIDTQRAWAVATNNTPIALVKTTDGGLNWQEIKPKIAP